MAVHVACSRIGQPRRAVSSRYCSLFSYDIKNEQNLKYDIKIVHVQCEQIWWEWQLQSSNATGV